MSKMAKYEDIPVYSEHSLRRLLQTDGKTILLITYVRDKNRGLLKTFYGSSEEAIMEEIKKYEVLKVLYAYGCKYYG